MKAHHHSMHASCVAYNGRAVLIFGASGSGKSSLALELISRGAQLVSDDRTLLSLTARGIVADAPQEIKGLIEARGVGILELPVAPPSVVQFAVDMDKIEKDRLPAFHDIDLLGDSMPCLHKSESPHFPAAILGYLMGKRKEPS